MENKQKEETKNTVVRSMAKKLANVSTSEGFAKKRKKQKNKPLTKYIIASCLAVVVSFILFFAAGTSEKKQMEQIAAAALTLKDNPLSRLEKALENKVLSPDQFAFYCRDMLLCYDSLPLQYKTDRPIIPKDEVYSSLCNVWMQLYPETRRRLINTLPGLSEKIDQYKDSMGLH